MWSRISTKTQIITCYVYVQPIRTNNPHIYSKKLSTCINFIILEIIEHIDIIHMVDLIYGRGLRQMASKETTGAHN